MNVGTNGRRGSVVMAGMPKSGKSTFLGALYHMLESGTAEAITLDILPAARQHLEGLRGRWLRVERERRTPKASPLLSDLEIAYARGRNGSVSALARPVRGVL